MKENVIKIKRGTTKKHRMCKKSYIWNPRTYTCKTGKYFGSIIGD